MIEVDEVVDVHGEVSAVGVDRDDEGPDEVKSEDEDTDCQVECLPSVALLEFRKLKQAGPHHCKELVSPNLIKVRNRA